MKNEYDPLAVLRDAVVASPDNHDLRRYFAAALLERGHFAEAESALKTILRHAPDDDSVRETLAEVFFQTGRFSAAVVVLEEVSGRQALSPPARILFAKSLAKGGEGARASAIYRELTQEHADWIDEGLEKELAAFFVSTGPVKEGAHEEGVSDPEEVIPPSDALFTRPKVTFANVGGMESVKAKIRMKLIHPIKNAELFKAYGKPIGGGLLLYGPPGCGKTYLARATAGEAKANFTSVGLHDILDMWLGQSERNLRAMFEMARARTPSVLFFDEVDALGANRSDMRHSASRTSINQFLAELDGAMDSNDGVFILGATNSPWHLDPAFRRPGRFDEIVFVPPPDTSAREAILRVHLSEKPAEEIDFATVASATPGFSGADLKSVVDRAIETVLEHSMKTGKVAPVTTKGLIQAAKATRPSTQEWFATARNHALYANQSGLYDDVLEYLKCSKH